MVSEQGSEIYDETPTRMQKAGQKRGQGQTSHRSDGNVDVFSMWTLIRSTKGQCQVGLLKECYLELRVYAKASSE